MNLRALFGRISISYLAMMAMILPLVIIGAPQWLVAPAIFGIYGAPRIRWHYEDFKRRSAVSASALYDVDRRGSILFLRSFGVDNLLVPHGLALPKWLLGQNAVFLTLEQVLVNVAFTYGPVGALADPSQKLQPLGAARDHSTDANWQDYIVERMRVAEDIIYVVGETGGLDWELKTAAEQGDHQKFIFVFPPRWHVHADNREFYERLLMLTGLPERPESPPTLLYYDNKKMPVLVTSTKQSARQYRLALRLAFESRRRL